MSLDEYKLSCEMFGHSLDVRAVAVGPLEAIISSSRDRTAKVWNLEVGNVYVETYTLRDHKNFVASICVLDDGALICTGSNDNTINVYGAGNIVPLVTLRGHQGTVCSLAAGFVPNTLISGSWDKTARIWTIGGFASPTSIILNGHDSAVWAVTTIPIAKQFVTASADKTICYWNQSGDRLKVLKGHTDCVRGLVGLPDGGLLSCANDAVIRWWNADGECVKEFHGHGNYIYSIALNPALGPDVFVTASEDSTIRMWSLSGGQLGEAMMLPAQSVWTVATVENGNIVTGTSDGVVRVFTKDSKRFASEAIQEAFGLAVRARKNQTKLELGGVKVNDLPGPEALLVDGTEGQTRIVRQPNGKVMCYQWTVREWLLVGDVTGAAGGTEPKPPKILHGGKEYDFVFNVDISDTGAPLKLPYNTNEDPWIVAQKFIHLHELPQAYLDQVAEFIIRNSGAVKQPMDDPSSGFVDPFTGEGRYIPGTASVITNRDVDMVDPFTGSSSYRTAGSNGAALGVEVKPFVPSDKYIPYKTYYMFNACDSKRVLLKLKQFNESQVDENLKVSESCLENIITLATPEPSNASLAHVVDLHSLMKWPSNNLFPVLDIVRLAVCDPTACVQLANAAFLDWILLRLHDRGPNELMAVRCVTNMMGHEMGRQIISKRLPKIVGHMNQTTRGTPNLQIAIASFLLNVTVMQLTTAPDREICRQMSEALRNFLDWSEDAEGFVRAYQALGNILNTPYANYSVSVVLSEDRIITRLRDQAQKRNPNVAERIYDAAYELLFKIESYEPLK